MSDPRTKIRSLLVKAKHAGTPEHEAELSRTMAERLAAKYAVDLVQLERELDGPTMTDPFFAPPSRGAAACFGCGRVQAVVGNLCFNCAVHSSMGDLFGDLFTETPPRRDPAWDRVRWADEAGPRATGGTTSTGKARLDHRGCDHEATPAARAKCRRDRARQA